MVSKKTMATVTILLLFSLVTVSAVFTAGYTALQSINPAAAVAAITIAAIGFVWFKKST